ncbi:MAG: ShlB/FhaC/HecB family hemolysin secretion/activation protein [Rubrivivax sp.]|nr:ShlB/FhaC/HecB family hemolysin secretion/activation protein [Rubrivivax sp.]
MLQRSGLRFIAAVCAGLVSTAVQAQAPSPPVSPTIPTPSELADRRPEVATDPSKLPAPLRAPPRQLGRPDEEVKVDITRYAVNAEAPESLKLALGQLTGGFTGKGKTFADMSDAAAEVTRFLQRDLGYYLGFAYIPEQEPADGVIRIEVLEGRLDQIELKWRDGLPVDRAIVDAYLAQLQPGDVLRVRDVERVVFLINDLRGLSAEFEVKAGRTPGTASLVVTPRALPLTTWQAELDNANARSLGQWRVNGSVYRNSPFGRGDSASASLIASEGLAFGLANYTIPVGGNGLRLGASVSALKYKVDQQAVPLGVRGQASTITAFGLYPIIRSRNLNLFAVASLDAKAYEDDVGGIVTKKDVANTNLGLTGDLRDSLLGGGINSLDMQLTTGRISFNDDPASDPPDSRFTKLSGRFVRLQNLVPGVLQAYLGGKLQKAWNNLDVTEQFRAGGPDGVRAFPAGEGSGDNGALVSLELRAIAPAEWLSAIGGQAVFSLFVDRAVVQLRNDQTDPTVTDNKLSFAGWGIGLNWDGPDGWDLRATLARPTINEPRDESDRPSARFYMQLGKQF